MTTLSYRVIDPWVLWSAAGGDLEVFRTLAWIYLEQAPGLEQRLGLALEQDARAEIWMASHTLKGMAGMLGATELCALLLLVEQAARDDRPAPPEADGISQLCSRVQDEVERCATQFDGTGVGRGA